VIVFKAGKTELGARAAASHTASLAGNYDVARACLEAAGAVVAETLDEFEDLIKTCTLLAGKTVAGRRVGIMSNAGFECSTVMDALGDLELATFGERTRAVLAETLPSFAHRDNPIDCTPMTGTEAFARSAAAILDCAAVDVAIISSVPVTPALDNLAPDPWGGHPENLHAADSQPRRLIEIMTATPKPAVVVIDSGRIYDPMAVMMERAGIPIFRKIDRAARALGTFCATA
jgi:acyl-CoA synthetase (NDP forming)